MAGLNGAIGGTLAAGLESMAQGLRKPVGIRTETAQMPKDGSWVPEATKGCALVRDALGLVPLDGLRISGWDLDTSPVVAGLRRNQIVESDLIRAIEGPLSKLTPRPGVAWTNSGWSRDGGRLASARQATDSIRRDIDHFRRETGAERVVVVNGMPTAPPIEQDPALGSLAAFEAALDSSSPALTASMLYFYAACREGCAHVNFTPNAVEVPALHELALNSRVPFVGRDGKTGQTFLKTVLAPAFRSRGLVVRGWFSTNILGNTDGLALSDPRSCRTKVESKLAALEQILGYPVVSESGEPAHVVSIHYYPTRGDAKEAWDNIDLLGFLDTPMQLKVNFLCKDSVLAAPLIVDLVRFAAHAHQRGEAGVLRYLSIYFKSPIFATTDPRVEHDFFEQDAMLARYLESSSGQSDASASHVGKKGAAPARVTA